MLPYGRKTPLPFPHFAAVTCRQSAPDSPRERGDSQEGGNRRCLPSCAPARRQRTPPAAGRGELPRSAERSSPLDFKRKTPRPLGANPLTQFAPPTQPVQRKTPRPSGANTLAQFASPAQPVLKKGCRPKRVNRLRGSVSPLSRC